MLIARSSPPDWRAPLLRTSYGTLLDKWWNTVASYVSPYSLTENWLPVAVPPEVSDRFTGHHKFISFRLLTGTCIKKNGEKGKELKKRSFYLFSVSLGTKLHRLQVLYCCLLKENYKSHVYMCNLLQIHYFFVLYNCSGHHIFLAGFKALSTNGNILVFIVKHIY